MVVKNTNQMDKSKSTYSNGTLVKLDKRTKRQKKGKVVGGGCLFVDFFNHYDHDFM
jgi:hypothetical protein